VGAYDPTRLANLGIGHAAIDCSGYTYFNPRTGHEFSAVAGFTYNSKNQDTQCQNGIDSTSIGVLPSSSRSRYLSAALWDMCINRSPTTSDKTPSWVDSGRA
jgi:hypothetical protein